PQLLAASADPSVLARALEQTSAGVGSGSLRDSLALAAQNFQQPIASGSEIVVFSDGTFEEPLAIRPLAAPVRFVTVGARRCPRAQRPSPSTWRGGTSWHWMIERPSRCRRTDGARCSLSRERRTRGGKR